MMEPHSAPQMNKTNRPLTSSFLSSPPIIQFIEFPHGQTAHQCKSERAANTGHALPQPEGQHQETAVSVLIEPLPRPNQPRSGPTPIDFLCLGKQLISLSCHLFVFLYGPVLVLLFCFLLISSSRLSLLLHHRSYHPSPELLLTLSLQT